jgi:predicted 3-demethylubiquinone-9 3-methyltransferase (glyoxalase superfamily)
MKKVRPFLWFDDQAEEAANFYISVFPNSRITNVHRYGEGGPGPAGKVMTMDFELDGEPFTALNGGPHFKFTEAVSFMIDCADQAEVDHYWDRLCEGGQPSRCGWLKDRFGLSWQVVPRGLPELIGGADRAGAGRAMAAMMQMSKIEVDKLQAAYDGQTSPL